jgi:hypothetical protein
MSLMPEPALKGLDDCGCCEGVTAETPAAIENRPGLSAIAYRAGVHATFLGSMQAALSATPNDALSALQTREPSDFTIALTDAWATALDVLTFYQERVANEAYLRTATERLSLLHLARLIGYELRPGVAAAARLAFTLETAVGAPQEITLPPGVRVQSIPGPGETPQTFETVETIAARPAWNAIRPRLTQPQVVTTGMATLWAAGVDANLKTGDRILIIASGAGGLRYALRRVAAAERDDANQRTRVDLESGPPSGLAPANATAGVWVMRAKASPFGHNAPKRPDTSNPANLAAAQEWSIDEPDRKALTLDATYDQIQDESWIVIDRPYLLLGWGTDLPLLLLALPLSFTLPQLLAGLRTHVLRKVKNVRTVSRAAYGITGRSTQLALDAEWLHEWEFSLAWLREMTVYAQSEPLALAEAPLSDDLPANAIELPGDFSELPEGRTVVVSGVIVGQALDGPRTSELATVGATGRSPLPGGYTTVTFAKDLVSSFDRRSVTINANVALATQGETVAEVLGSGNAAQPYQRYALKGAPVTYVASASADGVASTLRVRVNDLLWHEAPTLYGRGPAERVYTVRADDDAKATVQFGDGVTGARLPTGAENVRATYRKGIGAAGNVKAGQLSLLLTRPLGVREVSNPLPAAGGADRDEREDARRNAPLTVLTLGRVVSLRDYEDFSRAYPGIGKALATWTWDGQRRGIFVTVAGPGGVAIEEGGQTYTNLVDALHASGDLHVPLRVQTYTPAHFKLTATVTRSPDYLPEMVAAAVRAALLAAFSFDARAFGQPVARSEVLAVMQSVPGVIGIDLDALHRSDQPASLEVRLPASAPSTGGALAAGTAAELLTLDESGVGLTVA